ncbi:methyltransferase domain-containing protein [Methanosalsum natronophilum]|uniref:methyltransferase domain-containing protein n=1 Tax=Methanosalsum natronophilum TaxID=768733 RepID=UPI00216A15AC|nr:class I SAM-dependent methyltransferase [Methanosalsum natronophilum]MCS3924961.1 hypothetical protein [Methanosalsum natronophilum]
MVRSYLKKITDVNSNDSLITNLRMKRIDLLKELIKNHEKPIKIIDIGGTVSFWEKADFAGNDDYLITIVNIFHVDSVYSNIQTSIGDAKNLTEYPDNYFDIAFSNSVIEHVGGSKEQIQMATELKRLANEYFLQTPNFYFPFEPHFHYPFFQFLPFRIKVFLVRNFDLGRRKKASCNKKAYEIIKSVNLLRKKDIETLFPEGKIYEEKLFGLTYSLIVHGFNRD